MRCGQCHLPVSACYCRELRRAQCGLRVLVIRHAAERGRVSGTGKLVGQVLENSMVLDYGAPDSDLDLGAAIEDPAWLLYPDPARPPAGARPKTLLVVDGTWTQARRMRRRIPELRGKPILNLAGGAGVFLRAQRTDSELPTVLAVADALDYLAEADAAAALRDAFQSLRDRIRVLGGNRLAI